MAHSLIVKIRGPAGVTVEVLYGELPEPHGSLVAAARAALPAEYDGWATDGRALDLFFYGDDAADMWARLRPALGPAGFPPGSRAILRFGSGSSSASSGASGEEAPPPGLET